MHRRFLNLSLFAFSRVPRSFLFLLLPFSLLAQPVDHAQMFDWLYGQQTLPVLVLKTDLKSLTKAREVEPWFDAELSINDSITLPVQVKARGNMRRKTCDIPPIKIRFAGKEVPDSIGEFSETKMVVSCFSTLEHERLVLKEFLCYRLYNQITDLSLRTVLVKLQLAQTEKSKPGPERFAFLIEPELQMAQRQKGRPYEPRYLPLNRLEPRTLDRMALFQYMIGNTDWSVETRHNVKLLAYESGAPVPVAYDFDYAGIVNAPYAAPQKGLPIQEVTERWFLGLCREEADMKPTVDLFLEKKEALLACINRFDWLTDAERRQMDGYLDSFFGVLTNPKLFRKQVLEQCKAK